MNVKAIRAAAATRLRTVVDGTGAHLEASAFVAESIDPPFAYPVATSATYDATLDGTGTLILTLRLLTSRAEDQAGQELLDDFLADSGPTSVKAAFEDEPTLGGVCDDLHVQGWDGYRTFEIAATDYYGAELAVEILT